MKMLLIHSEYLKYKPTAKALKSISETEKKELKFENSLVVFTCAEKDDEKNIKEIAENSIKEIENKMQEVKAKKIIIYPYAHLSSDLAKPYVAEKILKQMEKQLEKRKLSYHISPFGWYKSFEIKCLGHPLSEAFKEIKADEEIESYDHVELLKRVSKSKLDKTKLKENDHRIIGQKLDLFSFNESAPGMVFWHHNGLIIYNKLINFWRDEHRKAGYQEISTPSILDKKLWQISGHWEKYKENIFLTEYEGREFAVKPMNCPGGIMVYKSRPKSYRDLPLRIAELGIVHRQELSGVLAGLFRVIRFTQDDAHIYCTENQLESEIKSIMNLIDKFYKKFNLPYHLELSTRPEKRIGSDRIWNKSEKILEDVLKKQKIKYKINKGDGAFYGPKIDFHIKDSLNRTWQCATIQLDFSMPERFDLEYVGEDNKKHRPVMIHRVIYGTLERFIGVLLEHTNGNLPVWLSPIQVRILSLTDRNIKICKEIFEKFKKEGIRIDSDFESTTVNQKIRNAELMKIPYIILIGDKEEKNNTLAVREREKKVKYGIKLEDLIDEIKQKINKRSE